MGWEGDLDLSYPIHRRPEC